MISELVSFVLFFHFKTISLLELLCRILARISNQDLFTPWVIVRLAVMSFAESWAGNSFATYECRDIKDLTLNNDPGIAIFFVLGDFACEYRLTHLVVVSVTMPCWRDVV